jgi:hypothetical protein
MSSSLCRRLAGLVLGTTLSLCMATWSSAAFAAAGFSSASSAAGEDLHFKPEQVLGFAKKVEREMANRGAYVAIVARMGRPPAEMPEGMHFTHVAFAVYSDITTADGRHLPGYVFHNLYQQDDHPDVSSLANDYAPDFFAAVAQLEAGVLIPSPELQQRLLQVMTSPTYEALHDPHYSVIANPYTLGRQNCTEFVLDVTNAAIYQTGNIDQIKAVERKYFVAQPVHVNPLKLMFGGMFVKEVSTTDQDMGNPVTATFETISQYVLKYDTGSVSFTVMPDNATQGGAAQP